MASIGNGISALEPSAPRFVTRATSAVADAVAAPAPPQPGQAPAPVATKSAVSAKDAVRDSRFEATPEARHVRQVVQQITATLAYAASVSVVRNGTSLHATIDISG